MLQPRRSRYRAPSALCHHPLAYSAARAASARVGPNSEHAAAPARAASTCHQSRKPLQMRSSAVRRRDRAELCTSHSQMRASECCHTEQKTHNSNISLVLCLDANAGLCFPKHAYAEAIWPISVGGMGDSRAGASSPPRSIRSTVAVCDSRRARSRSDKSSTEVEGTSRFMPSTVNTTPISAGTFGGIMPVTTGPSYENCRGRVVMPPPTCTCRGKVICARAQHPAYHRESWTIKRLSSRTSRLWPRPTPAAAVHWSAVSETH